MEGRLVSFWYASISMETIKKQSAIAWSVSGLLIVQVKDKMNPAQVMETKVSCQYFPHKLSK